MIIKFDENDEREDDDFISEIKPFIQSEPLRKRMDKEIEDKRNAIKDAALNIAALYGVGEEQLKETSKNVAFECETKPHDLSIPLFQVDSSIRDDGKKVFKIKKNINRP